MARERRRPTPKESNRWRRRRSTRCILPSYRLRSLSLLLRRFCVAAAALPTMGRRRIVRMRRGCCRGLRGIAAGLGIGGRLPQRCPIGRGCRCPTSMGRIVGRSLVAARWRGCRRRCRRCRGRAGFSPPPVSSSRSASGCVCWLFVSRHRCCWRRRMVGIGIHADIRHGCHASQLTVQQGDGFAWVLGFAFVAVVERIRLHIFT